MIEHLGARWSQADRAAAGKSTPTRARSTFALMIREGSWPVISKRFPELNNLPIYDRYGQHVKFLHPLHEPDEASAQAWAIVFSRWEAGANTSIHSLTAFEALVRLRDTGFWIAHDRGSVQEFLDWLQLLPAFEMTYSDIDQAAMFVRELLRS